METQTDARVWNMFSRREESQIWCAVPVESAVPQFLFSGEWDFSGQHPEPSAVPGFRRSTAAQSARMNGFYLFQVLRAAA